MNLNDEDAVKRYLGVSSLNSLTETELFNLANATAISDELRGRLLDQVPGFRDYAVQALNAAGDVLEATIDANEASRRDFHESVTDVRRTIGGLLDREGVSEEHQRALVDDLIETLKIERAKDSEDKRFISQEASATRVVQLLESGIPLAATLLAFGARVLVSRGSRS